MYLTYFTRMNLYTHLSAIGIITEYCFRQLHSHALTHILQSCWALEAFQRGRPEFQSQTHLQLPLSPTIKKMIENGRAISNAIFPYYISVCRQ